MDILVMAAAVADYRPKRQDQKLKKGNFDGTVVLERTTDILATLGASKKDGQVLAGFAAESEQLLENARGKLERKNLDLIFANDISNKDLGFATDRNRITALDDTGRKIELGTESKSRLARAIVNLIAEKLSASGHKVGLNSG